MGLNRQASRVFSLPIKAGPENKITILTEIISRDAVKSNTINTVHDLFFNVGHTV
jgi:hypothetical protein